MKVQALSIILSLVFFIDLFGWVEMKKYELIIESFSTALGNDDKVVKLHDLRVKKFNRTAQVLNGDFELLIDLDDNWTTEVHGNNFQGNQYKRMMSKDLGKFCEALYQDELEEEYEKLMKYLTPPVAWKTCPWPKNRYTITNFMVDDIDKLLPPYIPGNEKWEAQVRFSKDGEVLGGYNAYIILRSQQSLMNGG